MSHRRSFGMFLLLVSGAALAADGFDERLDQARQLTWKTESRPRGVEGLRELVKERPEAVEPRLELARVLTWTPATRAEGVGMLRQLHQERPQSADIAESLGEVLSWDASTRAESIDLLREVAKDPERQSATLLLAQVLSWTPATQGEAESIYRGVLAKDPSSTSAKVGLAHLLSWRGDFDTSTSYYQEALRHSPTDAAAATGLAEVEGWSGRPLASLATLDGIQGGEQSVDVRRARAAAYASLGMPGPAEKEYEAALAIDPSDTASRVAAQDLETKLRPRLTVGGTGFTESGDPDTSKLEMLAIPVSFEMGIGGNLTLAIVGVRGSFQNDLGTTHTTSYGAGISGALGRRLKLWSRFQQNDLDVADSEWTADVDLAIAASDRVELRVGAERNLLLDSRLSSVGEVTANTLYGPAVYEGADVGATVRIGTHWDVVGAATSGTVTGTGFLDNDRSTFYGGFGRTFTVGHGWLRAGASWYKMENDLDLEGFPQTDLGGDGVTTRGIGGYFSPFTFTNTMVRLDAAFPAGDKVRFRFAGAIGRQNAEDVFSDGSTDETSSEVTLGMTWRIHPRISMDVEVGRMDVASAFDRTRAAIGWTFGF